MKLEVNKLGVLLISGIMGCIALLLLFLIPITLMVIMSYVFILIASALFGIGNLYLVSKIKTEPHLLFIPTLLRRYMMASVSLSSAFIVIDYIYHARFLLTLFIILQLLLICYLSISTISLYMGRAQIQETEQHVKEKVSFLKLIQADVDFLSAKYPTCRKELEEVSSALRYSDPMSNDSLRPLEEEIKHTISRLIALSETEIAIIPEICEVTLRMIADRNNRAKLLK